MKIGLGVKGCVDGCTIEVGSAYLGGGSAAILPPLRSHYQRIKAKGATPLIVYQEQEPIGIISVSDTVRADAKDTLEQLKQMGIEKVGVLSGDHAESVQRVKEEVGATDAWAELNPQDKLEVIQQIRKSEIKGKILFVGDGINDAPALASADVGIAMGGQGTEVALETAHVALMNDDISKIPFLIQLSRRMLFTIKLNIVFGLAFNLAAVIAGGGGLLTPIMGAVVHNVGSVIVVISSASIAFSK
jgi:Cd2+/Zn2+-exporting ATPase